jgi:peptidoglycan/xylan/chitin deacetylase (PgdA/CDA1 family)
VGKYIRKEPELVKKIHQEGHQVANHTENHPFLINFYSSKGLTREIVSCQEVIQSITGHRPRYFRQVCGLVNINLGLVLKELDLVLVGWQVSSRDLHNKTPEELVRRLKKNVRPGAIILFHDGGEPNPKTRDDSLSKALPEIIDFFRKEGFSFLTVEELHKLQTAGMHNPS